MVGVPRYDGSLYTGSVSTFKFTVCVYMCDTLFFVQVFVRNQDSFADIQTNYNLTGETV